jgi:CRP-like cAMP-binding protein
MKMLKQSDLFWGMDKDFVKSAMEMSVKVNYEEKETIFKEGDPANAFYVLVKGRVQISLGESTREVYVAYQPGEIIGWSSLIGRETLSATATCLEPTIVSRFGRDSFLENLAKHPTEEAMLFKRVAMTLGNRLVTIFNSLDSRSRPSIAA